MLQEKLFLLKKSLKNIFCVQENKTAHSAFLYAYNNNNN